MNNKYRAIALVRNALEKHIRSKNDDEDDIIHERDLIMEQMYKEVWEMNREQIEKELEIKKSKELKEYKEKLDKDYKNKEKQDYIKRFSSLMFDGIIIATLVGLIINQATEIIGSLKKLLNTKCNIPVDLATLICIILISAVLLFTLGKNFVDKVSYIFNEAEEK